MFLEPSTCSKDCGNGYYKDLDTNNCKKCKEECYRCTDK